MSSFQKANKAKSKLRAALFGPSGSGKTMSALRIATGIVQKMGGRIALIDTEHRTAAKYADRFDFDTVDLDEPTVENLITMMGEAREYSVLIIDSMTHAWRELLQEVDQIAKAKYKGNTWSAWSEGTPTQNAMIDALLSFPGHVIATMRSKTEWETQDDGKGKKQTVRIGLAPEQGKGIEYEFDLLLEITAEHYATVIKDRTGKFQDKIIQKPGEPFGAELLAWLSEGVVQQPKAKGEPVNAAKDEHAAIVKYAEITGAGEPAEKQCQALHAQFTTHELSKVQFLAKLQALREEYRVAAEGIGAAGDAAGKTDTKKSKKSGGVVATTPSEAPTEPASLPDIF